MAARGRPVLTENSEISSDREIGDLIRQMSGVNPLWVTPESVAGLKLPQ
jgi:hypothetical protein